jgi:hypothetical protein
MDYVNPKELMHDAVMVAEKKASLSVGDMLLRGALSGVFLLPLPRERFPMQDCCATGVGSTPETCSAAFSMRCFSIRR